MTIKHTLCVYKSFSPIENMFEDVVGSTPVHSTYGASSDFDVPDPEWDLLSV